MAQNSCQSDFMFDGRPQVAQSYSVFRRAMFACVRHIKKRLNSHDLPRPLWLNADETCYRRALTKYDIYTENIGPIGLRNIEIFLARYQQRIPGSTMHLGLIGRDDGAPENSLLLQIINADEQAALEIAAEIRRHNGQAWVGVYKTDGTFIEIKGPKESVRLADTTESQTREVEALPNNVTSS
jgi:hypothetical protein